MTMMKVATRTGIFAVTVALGLGTASAGEPVAIIEEITADGTGLQFMDYVEEGRIIDLGADGMVTLGYLASCLTETIRGGRVVVGRKQSTVETSDVQRRRAPCDGGAIRLSAAEADKSGVIVFRKPPGPQMTLYGTSPFISAPSIGSTIIIERIDVPGERHELTLRDGFLDLADSATELRRGGIYRATAGDTELIFKVDQYAKAGRTPLISRLLPL